MAYEKADFYAAYGVYAVDPVTRHRFAKFRSPNVQGGAEITLRLHYHPAVQKPYKFIMAQRLVDWFAANGTPLTASDRVAVIGGAFGWTCEALEDLVQGLGAVSIDLSQYVQDTKDLSPDDELIESIEAQGYTHADGGVGQFLFEKFSDPNPRSRDGSKVIKEGLDSNQSRNKVRQALKNADPTWIITEEVWQILTQQEKDRYTDAAAAWGCGLVHIIDNIIVAG